MVSVTILGAGVTGMTVASQLPLSTRITIIGKELPGDPFTTELASPYAGACWAGVHSSNAREQDFQLTSLAGLWKLAKDYPESGIRITRMAEIMEYGRVEDLWYRSKVPNFRLLKKAELPPRAAYGVTYSTVCISPPVFLSWMRSRLEERGVKFQRGHVNSLQELKHFGHDILINASGANSKELKDVADSTLNPYRLQSILIKSDYDECYMYHSLNGYYFNMFGRGDGSTYIGGIEELGNPDRSVYDKDRQTILTRGHELLPSRLPSSNPADYQILYDIGNTYHFRPQDKGGEAGGYCYSFGVSRQVAQLVADLAYESPPLNKI